jgi:hypothetical protein
MRCDSAIVVSSGLPIVFESQPLPSNRFASSGVLRGWMKSVAPSASAFAHTGWNFGSENSRARDAAADRGALEAVFLHRRLELLDGEVGELQPCGWSFVSPCICVSRRPPDPSMRLGRGHYAQAPWQAPTACRARDGAARATLRLRPRTGRYAT